MITISKAWTFDSHHRLWVEGWDDEVNDKVFGKCAWPHGHTYRLEVTVTGERNDVGMIMNYFDLNRIVKPMIDGIAEKDPKRLDHNDLNKVFPGMLTTAENMVVAIADALRPRIEGFPPAGSVKLHSITLQETPNTKATWYAELSNANNPEG